MRYKKVLLTGITGFIGRNLAQTLDQEGFQSTAIIRPTSEESQLNDLLSKADISLLKVDLAERTALASQLREHRWDVIFHIGAVRGGRNVSREEYFKVNVEATEEIGQFASETEAKLIFCSSVGVYGAIPKILPAHVHTPFQDDNYYHYTKIEAESRLQTLVSAGLNCTIIRPAITYGEGDYGFPYTLVKMTDRGAFFLPPAPVKIHLADVDMLCEAFVAAAMRSLNSGVVYNVADVEPVDLKRLVDFIHLQLKGKKYPDWKRLPTFVFRTGEKMAQLMKNELWKARFELISRSWFYEVNSTGKDLGLVKRPTIPTFEKVIHWYRSLQG
jgi:nucleoside-diphosphate-sugar epimerase